MLINVRCFYTSKLDPNLRMDMASLCIFYVRRSEMCVHSFQFVWNCHTLDVIEILGSGMHVEMYLTVTLFCAVEWNFNEWKNNCVELLKKEDVRICLWNGNKIFGQEDSLLTIRIFHRNLNNKKQSKNKQMVYKEWQTQNKRMQYLLRIGSGQFWPHSACKMANGQLGGRSVDGQVHDIKND